MKPEDKPIDAAALSIDGLRRAFNAMRSQLNERHCTQASISYGRAGADRGWRRHFDRCMHDVGRQASNDKVKRGSGNLRRQLEG